MLTEKLNILMIVPTLKGGGAERVFSLLSSELASRGHRVTLALKTATGQNISRVSANVRVLDGEGSWLRLFCRLAYERAQKYDAAISTLDAGNCFLFLAVRLDVVRGRPIPIYRQAGIFNRAAGLRGLFLFITTRLALLFPCILLSNSRATLKSIEGILPRFHRIRLFEVIGNPIDTEFLEERCDTSRSQKNGGVGKKIRLACVSRFAANKRVGLAIDVVRALRGRGWDVLLDIYGEGSASATAHLQQLISNNKLDRYIVLRGYSENLDRELQHFDVLLHTSMFEGFGYVILEGMAAGLQVVICEKCGMPEELIEYGDLGFIADCSSVDKVADKVIQAFSNPVLVKKMRERVKGFCLRKIADKYEALLQSSCNTKSSLNS